MRVLRISFGLWLKRFVAGISVMVVWVCCARDGYGCKEFG